MHRIELLLNTLEELQESRGDLVIVEIGTIRNVTSAYEEGDGHSTRLIAEFIRDSGRNHSFTSIDLETNVARGYLERLHLSQYVTLVEGNSLDVLPTINQADVVYLDGANDAEAVLKEFKIVENIPHVVVVVDDVDMDSAEVVKGHEVVPYAQDKYDVTIKGRQARIDT